MTEGIMFQFVTGSGVVFLLGLGYYYYSRRRGYQLIADEENESNPSIELKNGVRKRALSYSSELLINGVFPPHVEEAPSVINILMYFNTLPSEEDLVEKFQVLTKYDRFRSTPRYDSKTKKWTFKYISAVDIAANHLKSYETSSEQELMSKVEELLAQDIPGYNQIPLWQLVRVENTGKGVSCVIIRVHHVIGDGIALIGSLSKVFSNTETGEELDLDIPGKMSGGGGGGSNGTIMGKINMALKVVVSFFQVLYLTISRYDSDISFTSKNKKALKMSKTRKVVLFPTIQLDFVKKLKNKAGVTVNDLLMTVMSGAILRYSQAMKDPLLTGSKKKAVKNRVLIPLAFPRPKHELEDARTAMRNKWAFISVEMPLNEATPVERLKKCNELTQAVKTSPNPVIQHWIQNTILPYAPTSLAKQTALDLLSRHSMVFSNLPGVEFPISISNQNMVSLQIVFHNILPQVLLISYAGAIFCNMSIDTDEIKHADELMPRFYLEELRDMAKGLGIEADDKDILTSMSAGGTIGLF